MAEFTSPCSSWNTRPTIFKHLYSMTSKNARDRKVIGHSTQVIVIPHILREGNSDGCRWGHASLASRPFLHFYHPRMRVGNVFGHVCLSVCLCVCLSVCVSVFLSVQAITFEPLDIDTSFLVCRYILTIARSSLSIKVIGSRSRSYEKKW